MRTPNAPTLKRHPWPTDSRKDGTPDPPGNAGLRTQTEERIIMDSNDSETVTISRVEYKQLKKDAATLNALEAGGVDNWEGYSDALALIDED